MGNWTIMGMAEEREAFWRSHHEAWQRRNLNQREYCAAQGLVLKRFENWRAKFRDEPEVPQKLLYRRRGRPSHMTGHMTEVGAGSMTVLAAGAAGRRRFSEEDKRRIVDEASQPGCSVSQTARRYGIAVRVSAGTRPQQARGPQEKPHGEADQVWWRRRRRTRPESARLEIIYQPLATL
jgi:transposase-like protein